MNTHDYEEASEWLIDFRTGEVDSDARRRFEAWLGASPEHIRAYLELTAIWEDVSGVDAQRDVDIDALIERARTASNVVSVDTRSRATPSTTRVTHKPRRFLMVASIALVALAAGASAFWQRYYHPTYDTDIGEQRSITLPDGSVVELNARSRIRLNFTEHERDVDLLEGQALFSVAKNKQRPFVVTAGLTRVRAIGTQFDVDRKHSATVVTVLEGRVAILGEADTSAPVTATGVAGVPLEIGAGEQVTVATAVAPHPRTANLVAATAWTQRRLVFDSTPLSEVVEEFNRYNTRQLVIDGAGLEDFHVSGAFSSTDPTPLLRFLRAQGNVRVTETRDRIVITRN
jgi:transmembrane sensor